MGNIVKVEKPASPRSISGVASMEHGEVHRIDTVLDKIEPIVIVVANRLDVALSPTVDKRRILGKRRRTVSVRSQVSEDESAQLPHRIRNVLDLSMILAAFWLSGLLETFAEYVEQPSVVRAANPLFFDITVFEGAAPMRAMQTN